MGASVSSDISNESTKANVVGSKLFESLEKNANAIYTKNPTQTGTRPLERVNSRLDEAFSRKDEIESEDVYKALFEKSFPDEMVRSYSPSDTQRRKENVSNIRDKSRESVDKFMNASDSKSMDLAKEEVLRGVLELRETIPVTRRIELNQVRERSPLTSSEASFASSIESRKVGKKSVSWADSVPDLSPASPASSDLSLRSTGSIMAR